jgi:hypothetical protein
MGARTGWVARLEDCAIVDGQLRAALVGRRLAAVRYVEIDYGEPYWDAQRFHTIDYGVEFDLDDGATWAFTWQQRGANETLLIHRGVVRDELRPDAEVSTWDVTGLWHGHFGSRIDRIETAWTKHRWGPAYGGPRWETQLDDGSESDYCLITVILSGASEACAVVTLGGDAADGRGTFTYLADNVAVFFSLAEAHEAGARLPGDADAPA